MATCCIRMVAISLKISGGVCARMIALSDWFFMFSSSCEAVARLSRGQPADGPRSLFEKFRVFRMLFHPIASVIGAILFGQMEFAPASSFLGQIPVHHSPNGGAAIFLVAAGDDLIHVFAIQLVNLRV